MFRFQHKHEARARSTFLTQYSHASYQHLPRCIHTWSTRCLKDGPCKNYYSPLKINKNQETNIWSKPISQLFRHPVPVDINIKVMNWFCHVGYPSSFTIYNVPIRNLNQQHCIVYTCIQLNARIQRRKCALRLCTYCLNRYLTYCLNRYLIQK